MTAPVTSRTRAGQSGKRIQCPDCGCAVTVYHFAWSAMVCRSCGGAPAKCEWLVRGYEEPPPPCVCGHDSEDHGYDPSGCAGSPCQWSEKVDSDGWPAGAVCACGDYNPAGKV